MWVTVAYGSSFRKEKKRKIWNIEPQQDKYENLIERVVLTFIYRLKKRLLPEYIKWFVRKNLKFKKTDNDLLIKGMIYFSKLQVRMKQINWNSVFCIIKKVLGSWSCVNINIALLDIIINIIYAFIDISVKVDVTCNLCYLYTNLYSYKY